MRLACVALVIYCVTAAAQSNPVPFVNQALVPASIQPGGSTFALTVNGTGFAPTAVVNWNGSSRLTVAISGSQLKATINASDVVKARTASITVTNPAPGGGTSNAVLFPIRKPLPEVAMAVTQVFPNAVAVVAGDFNNDGKLDVAWSDSYLNVSLGNGKGGFLSPIVTNFPGGVEMLTGDFNGDGKLDIAEANCCGDINVFLGNGDGTFTQSWFLRARGGGNLIAVADFNLDGYLDLYITGWDLGHQWFDFFLGQGDGTFVAGPKTMTSYFPGIPAFGDFTGDGKFDFVVPEGVNVNFGINLFAGNGDGSFQDFGTLPFGGYPFLGAADMNQDGKMDLVDNTACVLLGHGDGTFNLSGCGQSGGLGLSGLGDFNGDGHLDAAVIGIQGFTALVTIQLGAGDGTFSNSFSFVAGSANGNWQSGTFGDFNNDGMLDVISGGGFLLLQTTASLSPTSLAFGSLNVGTTSAPQTVTLKNIGTSALVINQISIAGTGAAYFSQTNNCGSSLAAGASCTITVTFSPKAGGTFTPSLRVSYVGVGSPQRVALSGTGVTPPKVSLKPTFLTYATQLVGTTSPAQNATLTNIGHQDVTISSISITGAFSQTNNCPSTLGVGLSCQFQIMFKPTVAGTAHGILSVNDNAIGSPQKVRLTGTGTVITFSPIGVNFGNQKVGTTSAAAPITLSNVGASAVSITQIAITGTNPGDFTQTNDCGNSVPAHGSCTISVKFKPTALGSRSAAVSVTDNGGDSPQSVPLAGTGT